MRISKRGPGIAAILSVGVVLTMFLSGGAYSASSDEIVFSDVEEQTRQFMEWERTIRLTPRQEALKKEALGAIPAPCCSDNSAYTCCCPCNLSRTIWGLSNYLITKQGREGEEPIDAGVTCTDQRGFDAGTQVVDGREITQVMHDIVCRAP